MNVNVSAGEQREVRKIFDKPDLFWYKSTMNKKKVVITFDYELFLGKDSGTAERSLLEPVNRILEIAVKYGGRALFFVDTLYLLRLEKADPETYKKVAEQLAAIVQAGSSIELHIHPQWLDAQLNVDMRWDLSEVAHFRPHSLDAATLKRVFAESTTRLNSIGSSVRDGYRVQAFRAGGWSVQPFGYLKEVFVENGIICDFSVSPGLFVDHRPLHYYDYRSVPIERGPYRFEDDPCRPEQNGSFIECPVTKIEDWKLLSHMSWRNYRRERIFGDGSTISAPVQEEPAGNKIKKLAARGITAFTFESYDLSYVRRIIRRSVPEIITGVAHPKNMNNHSLKSLEYVMKNMKTISVDELIDSIHENSEVV